MKCKKEKLFNMYKQMLLIRLFEEKVEELLGNRTIKGTAHLYTGQEAIAVGACSVLNQDDYITSTHRGHGHCIAKGGKVDKMMAELWGKETGYCKGKGGSMHIADSRMGNLGANGIVGGGIPIAVGAGLSCKIRKSKQVVICFFGDGATNEGSFHEAVNFAAIWNLPVVFICENNLYGISSSIKEACCVENLSERVRAYGIEGLTIDGNDLLKVQDVVEKAVRKARDGNGPTLIECLTYRWKGHSRSDPRVYRTREEENEWKQRCPIESFKKYLLDGICDEAELDNISNEAAERIDQAVAYAESSSFPALEQVLEDVYATPI